MMTIFSETIENAVGIEVHKDRYNNPDSNVSRFFVLVGAFANDTGIVPILFEVKTFSVDTTASLYVAVSLAEIKRSRIVGYTPGDKRTEPYPLPASTTVNLSNIFINVNTSDKNLLKYIPDGFLNNSQKEAKQIALKETADYIEKKMKRQVGETEIAPHVDWFVGEAYVDYQIDKNSIVFIFRRKIAAA